MGLVNSFMVTSSFTTAPPFSSTYFLHAIRITSEYVWPRASAIRRIASNTGLSKYRFNLMRSFLVRTIYSHNVAAACAGVNCSVTSAVEISSVSFS